MSVSEALRERIRLQSGDRCGYCLSAQRYVFAPLEIDHLLPTARGGTDDEENLWLACRMCNGYKGDRVHGRDPWTGEEVRLYDPRRQRWAEHFAWSADGTRILGRTSCGRATAAVLRLNSVIAVMVRREWVAAGWHPPA